MASIASITPLLAPNCRRPSRGFTLVEVMLSATLSAVLIGAVLATVLFLSRTAYRSVNYAEMDAESRKTLEMFARDTRMASAITWASATDLTLTVPTNETGTLTQKIRYSYDSASKEFRRQITSPSAGLVTVLLRGINTFQFRAYNISGAEIALTNLATAGASTKQLQLSLKSSRSRSTTADATNKVLSARFILRNKRVS